MTEKKNKLIPTKINIFEYGPKQMEIEVLPMDIKLGETPEDAFRLAFCRYLTKVGGFIGFEITNINISKPLLNTTLITVALDISFVCFIIHFFLATDFKHEDKIKAGKYILEIIVE